MKYKKEKSSNNTFTEINFLGDVTIIESAKEVIINNNCTISKGTKESIKEKRNANKTRE